MTRRGTHRISGVNVHDIEDLMKQIHEASMYSSDETAQGRLYVMLKSAILDAKKPGQDGYGNSSTSDVMAIAVLDEQLKTLIDAEFYIRHSMYRDKEAFK